MSLTSELFPEPLTPVTQTNDLQRKRDVDIAQVVVPRADDLERFLAARPPLGRNRNRQVAGEILAGEALGLCGIGVDPFGDRLTRTGAPSRSATRSA